jgi:hypothetical protein
LNEFRLFYTTLGAHLAAKGSKFVFSVSKIFLAIENPKVGALVHGVILICGVYDLVPLVETYIGRGIK